MSAIERAHLIYDGPLPAAVREAALDADMREWRRTRPVEEKIAGLIEIFEARSVIAAEEAASEWRRAKIELRKRHRDEALACLVRRGKWRWKARHWRDASEIAREELA